MRISDWSSDVCSSDLAGDGHALGRCAPRSVAGSRRQRAVRCPGRVDYWQLIKIIGTKQNRSEQQYDSAQMLANLASELDIAIVMTGQLNQDGIPQYGEGVLAAAGIVVRIQRPDDQEMVFFATLATNQGTRSEERSVGKELIRK